MDDNLLKMTKVADEINEAGTQSTKLYHQYGSPSDALWAKYKKIVKSVSTFENRLNKQRIEMEILSKDFKEIVAEIQKEHEGNKRVKIAVVPAEKDELFRQFCRDRVRTVAEGYDEVKDEKVSLRELYKAYHSWTETVGENLILLMDFETYCDKEFGNSFDKRIYSGLRVFLDSEDVELFDEMHNTISEEDDCIPSEEFFMKEKVGHQ